MSPTDLSKDGWEAWYHAHDLADGPQLHDVLELLVHVPQREPDEITTMDVHKYWEPRSVSDPYVFIYIDLKAALNLNKDQTPVCVFTLPKIKY